MICDYCSKPEVPFTAHLDLEAFFCLGIQVRVLLNRRPTFFSFFSFSLFNRPDVNYTSHRLQHGNI